MKCSECLYENPDLAKYCVKCGRILGRLCQNCNAINANEHNYCSECGHYLRTDSGLKKLMPVRPKQSNDGFSTKTTGGGERKYVTVLFSDLCSFTTLTEKNDPEEVKEILNLIFKEVHQIIQKYDGCMERIMGDGVMILFGAPKAHEDDPIRAIRTAFEIHQKVNAIGQTLTKKIGLKLQMHSGISTGMVVAAPIDLIPDSQQVTGDTVNLASRLAGLAQPEEILVERNTFEQSRNYFNFTVESIRRVKGKTQEVTVYGVLNPIKTPFHIHSSIGVQARLIGRKVELSQLKEGAKQLQTGRGTIFGIRGDAGTGKSRLLLELRNELDEKEFQWIEGHAYAYTQKIPYFPLIDMMERIWKIGEEDSISEIKTKISSGVKRLIGSRKIVEACIGTLHGVAYPETESMGPEVWNAHLYNAIVEILVALAHKHKAVFCLEDLHWADSSTIRFLRSVLPEFRYPALLIYSYRPPFTLLSTYQVKPVEHLHQQIHLKELSPTESQEMMGALLNTDVIPAKLSRFIKERTEGNPFYLEEMINSLLESEILENHNGQWRLSQTFTESTVPATVQGVIAARLDHLKSHSKRLLQEASVIGRSFQYDILKKITSIRSTIENCFSDLERIDLIRTRSLHPDLEFIFKHALTQEVGYNSLLKKDRQEIHERIARVMEDLFKNRISEFCEALAMHYSLGTSMTKAVYYLIKAGNKSLKCYALKESFAYFSDAYKFLTRIDEPSTSEKVLLIDLLNQWAFAFYYKGSYKELIELLEKHQDTADELVGRADSGFFYAWIGCALWHRAEFKKADPFLVKAIEYSKKDKNDEAPAFASIWLSWTLTEKGALPQALNHAQKAKNLCISGKVTSQYMHMESLAAMGYAYWHSGHRAKTQSIAEELIALGRLNSDTRALCLGHCCMGWSELIAGDLDQATIHFQKAIRISQDPWYSMFPQLALCLGQISLGDIDKATHIIEKLMDFSKSSGAEFVGEPGVFFQGVALALSGRWQEGVLQMQTVLDLWIVNQANLRWTLCAFIRAQVYLNFVLNRAEVKLPSGIEGPDKLAERANKLLCDCAQKASDIGMKAIEGRIWLSMGELNQHLNKPEEARRNWQKALSSFEQCDATLFVKKAHQALSVFEEVD